MKIASFGGIEFDCIVVRDRFPRTIERNRYHGRDGGDLRDRGLDFRETDCEIIFFERPRIRGEQIESGLSYRDRWHLFFAAAMRGRAQDFQHPTEGGYIAYVEDLEKVEDARELETIRASCKFVEDSTSPSPLVTGSHRPRASGLVDVELAVGNARDAVLEIDFGSETPDTTFLDDIEIFMDQWRDPDLSQDIAAQLGQATRAIEDAQRTLGLASDPDSYSAFKATEELAAALRNAAETARQSQPQLRQYIVAKAQPLRRLVTSIYGGQQALQRYDEVVDLNAIDDPGYIPQGTELIIPVDDVQRRVAIRSATT